MPNPVTLTSNPFVAPAGNHVAAPHDISNLMDQGYASYTVLVDTSAWSPADDLAVWTEFSPDDGNTWGWGAGPFMLKGGMHVDKQGAATPWAGGGGPLPTAASVTASGWPDNPPTVLARLRGLVPSTQSTRTRVSLT